MAYNASILFNRSNLISSHRQYYFKTISYTLESIKSQIRLYATSAQLTLTAAGNFLGYVDVDNGKNGDKAVSKAIITSSDPSIAPLLDISEYSAEMFIGDLESIIVVLRNVVDFDIVDVLRGNDINWTNTQPVENIIETIFALNFLNVKFDEIVDYVSENIYEINGLNVELVRSELVNDGVLVAQAVRHLIDGLLVSGAIEINTVNDFETVADIDVLSLLEKPYLLAVADALEDIFSMTVVEQAMYVVMDQYTEFVPEDFQFVLETGITAEQLHEDLLSIVDISCMLCYNRTFSGVYFLTLRKKL